STTKMILLKRNRRMVSLFLDRNYTFPFKGKAGLGMGLVGAEQPIPTLTLPLKGRELLPGSFGNAIKGGWRKKTAHFQSAP
ncbi:MAG: hypothetical protein OEV23_09020, partial [Gallionella sp.]|nr:hypothetical protein [Gallionella sp.]